MAAVALSPLFHACRSVGIAIQRQGNSRLWQQKYLEAYGRHLLRENPNAQTVVLRRYAHWPLPYNYVSNSIKGLRRQITQLNEQNRTAEANELSSNLVKEAIIRGYSYFKEDFPREMQNRRIDDQGYEVLAEASQTRTDLEPDAKSKPWTGKTSARIRQLAPGDHPDDRRRTRLFE